MIPTRLTFLRIWLGRMHRVCRMFGMLWVVWMFLDRLRLTFFRLGLNLLLGTLRRFASSRLLRLMRFLRLRFSRLRLLRLRLRNSRCVSLPALLRHNFGRLDLMPLPLLLLRGLRLPLLVVVLVFLVRRPRYG